MNPTPPTAVKAQGWEIVAVQRSRSEFESAKKPSAQRFSWLAKVRVEHG